MHFSCANIWDKGDYYTINQDSFAIQAVFTGNGPYGMAMICDGVGSLSDGEYASGTTVETMTTWFYQGALPLLCQNSSEKTLLCSCKRALGDVHRQLSEKGEKKGLLMGTTFSMIILTLHGFYLFHIGDCSCYQIGSVVKELTRPQINTRGELLGVIGVGEMPGLLFKRGKYRRKERFFLCSDGMKRCLSVQGLYALGKNDLTERDLHKLLNEMLHRGRRKGERDNCTGIVIGRK